MNSEYFVKYNAMSPDLSFNSFAVQKLVQQREAEFQYVPIYDGKTFEKSTQLHTSSLFHASLDIYIINEWIQYIIATTAMDKQNY